MIELPKELSKNFYWLTQVNSPVYDTRLHIQTILIEDGIAYKTNGTAIFSIKTGLKNGIYRVMKRAKTKVSLIQDHDLKRSDWPEMRRLYKPLSKFKPESEVAYNGYYSAPAVIKVIVDLASMGIMINYKYLEKLFSFDDFFHYLGHDTFYNKNFAIYFANSDRSKMAIIMEMKE